MSDLSAESDVHRPITDTLPLGNHVPVGGSALLCLQVVGRARTRLILASTFFFINVAASMLPLRLAFSFDH